MSDGGSLSVLSRFLISALTDPVTAILSPPPPLVRLHHLSLGHPDMVSDPITSPQHLSPLLPLSPKQCQSALHTIVSLGHLDLLSDPIVHSLIKTKWAKHASWHWSINIFMYSCMIVGYTCGGLGGTTWGLVSCRARRLHRLRLPRVGRGARPPFVSPVSGARALPRSRPPSLRSPPSSPYVPLPLLPAHDRHIPPPSPLFPLSHISPPSPPPLSLLCQHYRHGLWVQGDTSAVRKIHDGPHTPTLGGILPEIEKKYALHVCNACVHVFMFLTLVRAPHQVLKESLWSYGNCRDDGKTLWVFTNSSGQQARGAGIGIHKRVFSAFFLSVLSAPLPSPRLGAVDHDTSIGVHERVVSLSASFLLRSPRLAYVT